MFSGWRKIIVFRLAIVVSCIICSPVMAKTLKNCGATSDPNDLTVYEFYGEAELDNFGTGLDCAGDFDGDGVVDLVVGSPYSDAGAQDGGAAYVFLGGLSADPNWDFRLLAEAANDQLGYTVAGVGDLDGDGFDDIAIGARYSDRTGTDRGAVWVIFGSEAPFGLRQLVLTSQSSGLQAFGQALAGGDFNGDGYSDLVVSAPRRHTSSFELEKVYIFYGGSPMDDAADVVLEAEDYDHEFGWSAACAGDLNNDGYDDLIVGARYYGTWLDPQRGKAYIFFGGNPMDTTADVDLVGEAIYCLLGYSVAGAGDVNGDGFDDVLIGSPWYPGGAGAGNPAWGKVYVLYGAAGTTMDNLPDAKFVGEATDDQFGWSVDGGLDMDKDGFDDIIIGARFKDCPSRDGGGVYIYYGGDPMGIYPDISAGSSETDDALGSSVAMIGNWSESMPLAAGAAIWNDAGKDVNDPAHEGAYGAVFAFAAPASIPGDFNRDRCMDWTDLYILTQHWLDAVCTDLNWCGEADLDRSTVVDFADYALFAHRWFEGCSY